MGRPPKRNLNYSTWDVDVLENDTSIDNLIDAQGPAGFYVYFALCQKAYATDGYFYRWGYDNAASTARKLGGGLKSTQVRAIVDLCVSLGLFDKALFTTHGILTSRAIQSRYLDGIARRTGEIPIIVEYWLLEVTPRAGLVFVHKNGETAYKNPNNKQQKPSFCTEDYAPCYRCARRAINCHTACTDYAEYRKVCNQIQTAREAERRIDAADARQSAPPFKLSGRVFSKPSAALWTRSRHSCLPLGTQFCLPSLPQVTQ